MAATLGSAVTAVNGPRSTWSNDSGAQAATLRSMPGSIQSIERAAAVLRDTGRYSLGGGLRRLDGGGWDRHELRSCAMNWADSLAGSAGQEVLLGMPAGTGAEPHMAKRSLCDAGT